MTDTDRPAADTAWNSIAQSPFVSLATYRRSGEAVPTPVWVARDGDHLVVTSERSTGKVKRLRNDPRVTLTACSRMGAVEPDAVTVVGHAVVAGSNAEHPTATAALLAKYGLQYRAILAVEGVMRRLQRRPGDRVIIRIARP